MRCTIPSGSNGPTTRVRSCKYAAFATGSSADKRDCREELWVHRIALAMASAAAALWSVADVSRAARLACRRRA